MNFILTLFYLFIFLDGGWSKVPYFDMAPKQLTGLVSRPGNERSEVNLLKWVLSEQCCLCCLPGVLCITEPAAVTGSVNMARVP